jgi:spermidine synthase
MNDLREQPQKFAALTAFNCGALSLALEIVLNRLALREMGSGALAATATITLFLAGLAAGAFIAQSLPRRLGAVARFSPFALTLVALVLACLARLEGALTWPIIFVFLFMSGTLSALTVSALASLDKNSINANKIYLASNIGCVLGTATTSFLFLPRFGICGTLLTSALLSIPLALCALRLAELKSPHIVADSATDIDKAEQLERGAAIILFIAPLVLTVLECAWMRISSMVCGSSSHTISVALLCIIAAMTGGNALAIKVADSKHLAQVRQTALTAGALAALTSLTVLPWLAEIFQQLRIFLQSIAVLQNFPTVSYLVPRIGAMAILTLPTCFCLGLIYPLFTSRLDKSQWRAAFALSSTGAIIGPALFTFVFLELPFVSPISETVKAAVITLALTAFFYRLPGNRLTLSVALKTVTVATAAIAIMSAARPHNLISGFAYFPAAPTAVEQVKLEQKHWPLIYYKEGQNITVSVEENGPANMRILKSDGKVEASIPIDKTRAATGTDLSTQYLLGLLPTVLSNADNLNCLVIGLGSGTTSGVVSQLPAISKVDVAEIERAMNGAAACFTSSKTSSASSGSTTRVIRTDARAHLKNSGQKYDLIISQPSEPWTNGSAGLFTREFFLAEKNCLSEHGLAAQWLQLYGLTNAELICALRTFAETFPQATIFHQAGAGEIILIGTRDNRPLSVKAVAAQKRFFTAPYRELFGNAAIAGLVELKALQKTASPGALSADQSSAINTDDNLKLEFGAGSLLIDGAGEQEKRLDSNLALIDGLGHMTDVKGLSKLDTTPVNGETIDNELRRDPCAYLYINLKAKNLLLEGQADEALLLLQRSNKIYPSLFETHMLLALSDGMLGKLEEALKETQEAHRLNTRDCHPYLVAACIYEARGEYANALSNLSLARQKCPDNEILNQIGVAERISEISRSVPAKASSKPGTLKSNLIRLLKALESL